MRAAELAGVSPAAFFAQPADEFMAAADAESDGEWMIFAKDSLGRILPGSQLVPTEGTAMVVSAPNVGKTWLSLYVAKRALEAGRDVYYVQQEGTKKAFAARIKDLGIHVDEHFWISHRRGFDLENEKAMAEVFEFAQHVETPVFIFDPFAGVWFGNENDSREVGEMLRMLGRLYIANARSLLLVDHHMSKAAAGGGDNAPPKIYAGRGSSKLAGWFDTLINLTNGQKANGCVSFCAERIKDRRLGPGEPVDMTLSFPGGELTISEWRNPEEDELRGAIRDAIDGGAKNRSEVCRRARKGRTKLWAVMDRMAKAGELQFP